MGGPWRALAQPLGSQAQPLGSQAQPNSFSPQNGFITHRKAPQFHQLSRWLVSDDPAGEEVG